jgi:uncharacterized membrane protein YfhO
LRFANCAKSNGYVVLAFFASAVLMLFVWFCFKMSPFGGTTILRMDLYHQYGPLFAELYERLSGGGSLLYSWNTGLGGGFLGNFFNYLSSPTGLLVLLFGRVNIPEAIATMILVKCAFASGAFAYFLRRVFGKQDASIAAFGVLYSFCSFFIAYYWNVMWLDAMALLPLVALGICLIVKEKKFLLYTVSLTLTLLTSYYMGFMVCIFSVLFFIVQYFSAHTLSATFDLQGKTSAWQKIKKSRFLSCALLFGFGSILAGALAAFALLPVFFSLRYSSATNDMFPKSYQSFFAIFDFLANHFADVNPTIRSSGDDVLPNLYSGVLTLLLVPLFLFVPSYKARDKVLHVGVLALMFFSFNTNYLNFIWHGFHSPNDLPYRFSFLYSFLLLYIAFRTLKKIKEVPVKAIVAAGVGVVFFAVIVEKIGSKNVEELSVYLTILFAAIYTLLFASMARAPKVRQSALALLLLCCAVTEVCAADTKNFEITQEKVNFTAGLTAFDKVKAGIQEEDSGFYRMEFTDLRTRMDPSLFHYSGVSTFSSMAYVHTSNFESHIGLGGNYINSYTYNPNTPVYNAMHNLKYVIENQSATTGIVGSTYLDTLNPAFYQTKSSYDRYTVLENRFYLPIAYRVNNDFDDWIWTSGEFGGDPFAYQADYWERATGIADVFTPLDFTVASDFFAPAGVSADAAGDYVSYSGASDGENIRLRITSEVRKNAYIYVDSSNVSSINVIRDLGKETERREYRSHDEKCIWDIGVVGPDQPITLDLVLDAEAPETGGFYCRVKAIDYDRFAQGYEQLKADSLRVTAYSDTTIKGTINAEAGLLYTSIPYDEGWQVTIDGKRVSVDKYVSLGKRQQEQWEKKGAAAYGAFLAIPLTAGEHQITFHYVPRGLRLGALISASAVMLLGLLGLFFEFRKMAKRRKEEKQLVAAGLNRTIDTPVFVPESPVGTMFSTAGLTPESFSLDIDPEDDEEGGFSFADVPSTVAAEPPDETEEEKEPIPEEEAPAKEKLPPEEKPDQMPIEESFTPPASSAVTALQQLKARAEALQRQIQGETLYGTPPQTPPEQEKPAIKPPSAAREYLGDDDEPPTFRLI